jgi:hypothetical protein
MPYSLFAFGVAFVLRQNRRYEITRSGLISYSFNGDFMLA